MITRVNKKELYEHLLNEMCEAEEYETCCLLRDKLTIINPYEYIELEETPEGYLFIDKNNQLD